MTEGEVHNGLHRLGGLFLFWVGVGWVWSYLI
jgi:hypothetical protein